MKILNRTAIISIATILAILVVDQASKFYIKTSFSYGDGFDIFGLSWAKIHFVENEGMAFGMAFGGITGKYILSVFRIIMAGFLVYLLAKMIRSGETLGLVISFSLIVAGAVGNIIDSVFYGVLFSASLFHGGPAEFLPESGGYAPWLQGKVVDMFHFPMIKTHYPMWVPKLGGKEFEFFRPVFNVADAAISVGVVSILLFYRRFFKS